MHPNKKRAPVAPLTALVATLFSAVFPPAAAAAADTELGQVVVTANRQATRSNELLSDVSVVTHLLPTASAVQWSLVNQIRSVIPGAQVQLRERSLAWTRDPHAPKVRLVSALVTLRVGLVLLRREFQVPDSAPDVPARTQEDELMKA